jgi:putative RNA 2'-phosphotransferase
MSARLERLSRTISYALRHRPEQFALELDNDGWVPLDALVAAIARDPKWRDLKVDDVFAVIASEDKQRHEIRGQSIRASYGHSLAAKVEHPPAMPPDLLYHGTSPVVLEQIRRDGLKPMRRQYVHLSPDIKTATAVARRRTRTPVIITVLAKKAHSDGTIFHHGNKQVWLAERIDASYLLFP